MGLEVAYRVDCYAVETEYAVDSELDRGIRPAENTFLRCGKGRRPKSWLGRRSRRHSTRPVERQMATTFQVTSDHHQSVQSHQ